MRGKIKQSGIIIPKLPYVLRRWPSSLYLLEQLIKQRQAPFFQKIMIWGGGWPSYIPQKIRKRLCREVKLNAHCNSYHHPWHTVAVIIQAALIGRWARLPAWDHRMLLLAALCHDFDHRGRFASRKTGREEQRSALRAERLIFIRPGSGCLRRRFKGMIMSTARDGVQSAINMDHSTAILRDADVFGSLFFRVGIAINFSEAVLREKKQYKLKPSKAEYELKEFHDFVSRQGFDHQATSEMAARAGNYPAAIHISPGAGKRLGFSCQQIIQPPQL